MTCTWCSGEIRDGRCSNCGVPAEQREAAEAAKNPEEPVDSADPGRVQDGLREFIRLAGDDPDAPHLCEAPGRALWSLLERLSGYRHDPAAILEPRDQARGNALIRAKGSVEPVCSTCLTPWSGAVLLSTRLDEDSHDVDAQQCAELVAALGARLTHPDLLAQQIAAALVDLGRARSARVAVTTTHFCAHQRAERREDCSALVVIRREAEDGSTIPAD